VANTIKCFKITISGKLRDRGLRFSAKYMAVPLQITGFVEYTHDCAILIEAEGNEEQLEQFIASLRNFIKSWQVSDISIVETTPKGYSSFEIRNSANAFETNVHRPYAVRYLLLLWMRIQRMFGSGKQQITHHKNKHS